MNWGFIPTSSVLTLSIPTLSIPTLSTHTSSIPTLSTLTKWELMKWKVDKVGRFAINYNILVLENTWLDGEQFSHAMWSVFGNRTV